MAETSIKITAETVEANKQIQTLGETLAQMGEHGAGLKETFMGLKEHVLHLAEAFGAVEGVKMFVEMIKGSLEAADQLSKLSEKTGTSVEVLAGLKFAADQNGTSLEAVAQAGKKLSTAMVANRDVLQQYGITAKDSTGAMLQLADIFAAMPDGVEKSALAVKLLGKNGQEMIPFLNKGTEELQKLIEEGQKLNPITAEGARQSREFNEQMDKFSATSKAARIALVQDMVPALNEIITAMIEAQKQYGTLFALFVGAGVGGAKILGVEIDPQKHAQNELNDLLKQQLSIKRDIEIENKRIQSGEYDGLQKTAAQEEVAAAQAKLDALNQKIKLQIKAVNDPQIAAGQAAASQRAADEARQKANEGKGKKLSDALGNGGAAPTDPFASLNQSLDKHIALSSAELAGTEKLSAAQKFSIENLATIKDVWDKLTASEKQNFAASEQHALMQNKVALEQGLANEKREQAHKAMLAESGIMDKLNGSFDDYIDAQKRGMEIMSATDRARSAAYEKINKEADAAAQATDKLYDEGTLSAKQYLDALDKIELKYGKHVATLGEVIAQEDKNSENWVYGAKQAGKHYLESMGTVASQTEKLFTGAFNGAENALAKFFQTGKLGMKDFENVISGELAKLAAQKTLGGLGSLMSGMSDSSTFTSLASIFAHANGGIMTSGGPLPLKAYSNGGVVNSPQLALFGEGRTPEAYVPLPDGRSIPVNLSGIAPSASGGSATGGVNINIIMNTATGGITSQTTGSSSANTSSLNQFGQTLAQAVRAQIVQEQRQGGLLAPQAA